MSSFLIHLICKHTDVMSNRKMLCMLLEKKKVRTEMAEDGVEVVELAKSGRLENFRIIFMDNQMPKMVRELVTECEFLNE